MATAGSRGLGARNFVCCCCVCWWWWRLIDWEALEGPRSWSAAVGLGLERIGARPHVRGGPQMVGGPLRIWMEVLGPGRSATVLVLVFIGGRVRPRMVGGPMRTCGRGPHGWRHPGGRAVLVAVLIRWVAACSCCRVVGHAGGGGLPRCRRSLLVNIITVSAVVGCCCPLARVTVHANVHLIRRSVVVVVSDVVGTGRLRE